MKNKRLWIAALAVAGGLLAGCASRTPAPAAPAPTADETLTVQVRQSLHNSTDVNGWSLSVDSHGGQVTLTGTVTSQKQKQAAERVAYAVPGVKLVFNQIVVKE